MWSPWKTMEHVNDFWRTFHGVAVGLVQCNELLLVVGVSLLYFSPVCGFLLLHLV